ncbi:MAG: type II toxin-antitoxin system death-on-curing family toxin [Candidatus Didemnitutus sp.]|nr:type II toxin-antitoxin system death-on-curing family toxin [Candidatus Didemnitutus sp.]
MSTEHDECFHLTMEIVLEIHAAAIAGFGGSDGLRERALLESAIAAPQATFGGESVYVDVPEMAAAYLFYLCRNHPFIDGNKRAALGACLVFLRLNGIEPAPDGPDWEQLTLDVAASKLDRDATTERLRTLLPGAKPRKTKARAKTNR